MDNQADKAAAEVDHNSPFTPGPLVAGCRACLTTHWTRQIGGRIYCARAFPDFPNDRLVEIDRNGYEVPAHA